jgi:hypothetical protein
VGESFGFPDCADAATEISNISRPEKMGIGNRCKLSPRGNARPSNHKPEVGVRLLGRRLKSSEAEASILALLRHDIALPASQMQTNPPGSNFNSSIFAWFGQSERTSRAVSDDVLRANVARNAFGLA